MAVIHSNEGQVFLLFKDPSERTLEPARKLLQESGQWIPSARGKESDQFKTKDDLIAQIELMKREATEASETNTTEETEQDVKRSLVRVFYKRKAWKDGREQNMRKPGVWVQQWLTSFGEFLDTYSVIIEVVKAVEPQYGGLAYGILSVFLAIPVHKSHHEEEIERALIEFSCAFPRLKIIKDIYSENPEKSDTLKSFIVEVYAEVIKFARESVAYYENSSFGRVKNSIRNPTKTEIQAKVQLVRKLLADVRWESEILMQQQIKELNEDLKFLRQAETDRQKTDDLKTLAELEHKLKIEKSDMHTETDRYRKVLDEAFSDVVERSNTDHLITLEEFYSEPKVDRWLNSESPCILVLAGQNDSSINNTTLCWLSYSAIILTEIHKSSNEITAHYFCQTTSTMIDRHRPIIPTVLANLAYQIAKYKPELVRARLDRVVKALSADAWDDEVKGLRGANELFLDMLRSLQPETTVTLILDRIDQCRLNSDTEDSQSGAKILEQWLIELVSQAPVLLKVLVVVGVYPSTVESRYLSPVNRAGRKKDKLVKEGVVLEKLDWHQQLVE